MEERLLPVIGSWRTNLTVRQPAPPVGISKSAGDRITDHVGPLSALEQRQCFRAGTVRNVDGTLVSTGAHSAAEQSKSSTQTHGWLLWSDGRCLGTASTSQCRET